ncbi:uncharacterized protein LOC131171341, partial [Hevea brasiliensis]|uniref:uncharacterized protein LOC131171341 n=1 Tax=Hevea brasiliensis TaxID=3981 RepID=UPI0025EEA95C
LEVSFTTLTVQKYFSFSWVVLEENDTDFLGLSGETDDDFAQTVNLVAEYKFPQVHISQFYPRPGTPAARMKKVPSNIVKKRSRELTSVFEAFTPYNGMEGRVERIWITEIATDGIHLVGHTKAYVQVLVVAPESMLGASAIVKITSVGRWSVFGEVIQALNQMDGKTVSAEKLPGEDKCSPCSEPCETCACAKESEPCDCGPESCGGQNALEESAIPQNDMLLDDRNRRNLIGWFLRKRKNQMPRKLENGIAVGSMKKQEWIGGNSSTWSIVGRALVGGMLVSLLSVVALLIHLSFRTISSK